MTYRQELEDRYGLKVADADVVTETDTEFFFNTDHGMVGFSKATYDFWRNQKIGGKEDMEFTAAVADAYNRCAKGMNHD